MSTTAIIAECGLDSNDPRIQKLVNILEQRERSRLIFLVENEGVIAYCDRDSRQFQVVRNEDGIWSTLSGFGIYHDTPEQAIDFARGLS